MAAREDYARKGFEVEYVDVRAKVEDLERMLKLTSRRQVPVIVLDGEITIGHGGS